MDTIKSFRTRKQKREPVPFELVVEIDEDVEQPTVEIDDPQWDPAEQDDPTADPPKVANPLYGEVQERPEDPDNLDSDLVKVRVYTFHARGAVPGALLLNMVASSVAGQGVQVASLQRFLYQALVKGDRDRFEQVVEQSDPPIEIDQIQEVVGYLASKLGNARPTK